MAFDVSHPHSQWLNLVYVKTWFNSVALDVFQLCKEDTPPLLKFAAFQNIDPKLVTLDTSHAPRSWSKEVFPLNKLF